MKKKEEILSFEIYKHPPLCWRSNLISVSSINFKCFFTNKIYNYNDNKITSIWRQYHAWEYNDKFYLPKYGKEKKNRRDNSKCSCQPQGSFYFVGHHVCLETKMHKMLVVNIKLWVPLIWINIWVYIYLIYNRKHKNKVVWSKMSCSVYFFLSQ